MTDELWLDLPGAPAGFLLDPDDDRTGSHEDDGTGCAELVDAFLWDMPGRENALARGDGEAS